MSLEIKYLSVDSRAGRVIASQGRAPNLLKSLDEVEKAALAALCDEDGNLVADVAESFRHVIIEHNERLKATDADDEQPAGEPVGTQQTFITEPSKPEEPPPAADAATDAPSED